MGRLEGFVLDSVVVRSECAIVVGYAIADIVMVIIHYKQIGEIGYFLHHIATVSAYFYVMTYGFIVLTLKVFCSNFMEWMLDALKFSKTSNLFFINGLLMVGSFYAVRILILPFYWYKIYTIYGTDDFIKLGFAQAVMIVTSIMLDGLNCFWGYRMYLGARKVVKLKLDDNKNETNKEK
ncbi:hypothetical protein KUTeg_015954 [Tegillarca granosa]|uniref:TLC domain-containing protein n=1 Tax=Tegillarca granosa TaxID=220873 RepID=A0ABQ9EJF7_TEGGR|nr:hypothetical protein KUTeg_015954 [Tegillarca granosa]